MAGRITSLVLGALVIASPILSRADQAPAPAPAPAPVPDPAAEVQLDKKIAVWRFDALGIDNEIVQRLETTFRMELDRLDRQPLPTRRDVERTATTAEKDCTGEEKCLAAIGKRLGVDLMVTGTVGSLGDNYVLNIKVIEVATGKSQKIQSDPLRGSPDDLIEGVRVAAYKLLAPDQIHGAVQIQSDLVGAEVSFDGKLVGRTPLPRNGVISKQPLGKHKLRVQAKGYDPFDKEVEVRFQKVSPVVVRLLASTEVTGTGVTLERERRPLYTRTWFIVTVGLAVIGLGVAIGASKGAVPCRKFTTEFPNGTSC